MKTETSIGPKGPVRAAFNRLRAELKELEKQPPVEDRVRTLLGDYFWLSSLKANTRYARLQDDHDGEFNGVLDVIFSEDGDAWISLDAPARFRMPGTGGGRSQYTRTALMILAEAIRMDNEASPQHEKL